jgi:hypothetical protein
MRKRIIWAIVAGTLTLAAARPARAGCCDDFWSCVGTVLTAGVSCKAQQIADAIALTKNLIAAVDQTKANVSKASDDTIDAATNAIETSRSDVVQKSTQSVNRLTDADSRLQMLNSNPGVARAPGALAGARPVTGSAAVAPNAAAAAAAPVAAANAPSNAQAAAPAAVAPSGAGAPSRAGAPGAGLSPGPMTSIAVDLPADRARLKDALTRAAGIVRQARTDAEAKESKTIQSTADQAKMMGTQNVQGARMIATTNLISPLDRVRATLAHVLEIILNPVDFTSVSKVINDTIAEINSKSQPTFDAMGEKMMDGPRNKLDDANQRSEKLNQQAEMGGKIADAAEKAQKMGTQGALDKLEALVGKPKSNNVTLSAIALAGAPQQTAGTLMSTRVSALVRPVTQAAGGRIATSTATLAQNWTALQPRLAPPAPIAVTPAMSQRVDSDLKKMFEGKSRADSEKTKAQLLAEARTRFTSDPKTLAAVESYLNEKTTPLLQAAPVAPAAARSDVVRQAR